MRKNAFTLVELLAVLVIIGILSAISIAIYSNSIIDSKDKLSDFQKKQLIDAARTYVAINTINFNNKFDNMTFGDPTSCVALAVDVLTTEGLISENIVDPKDTKTKLEGYIKIEYDVATSQYKYEYIGEKAEDSACKYKSFVRDGSIIHEPAD